jgi:hypothetical protein
MYEHGKQSGLRRAVWSGPIMRPKKKAVAVIFVVKPATVVYLNSLLNTEKTTVNIGKG